ncbi:autotransporter outer membrane beta-barrel domain-containing protein [Microbacterium schleiferi]|uniref:WxL domain-containing protein n=1 Tax=Microbacterium schleiferi TaxID=69362 RepID=A0ABU7V8L2_9MICO
MNSKKFFSRAVIAGVAAAALVVTGATAASAAEGRDAGDGRKLEQPQTNGSLDTYFLLDGSTGAYIGETDANSDGWIDTAFAPSKNLVAVGNNNGTLGQAATYAAMDPAIVTGGDNSWDQLYVVLDDNISQGISNWSAWTVSAAIDRKAAAFTSLTLSGKTNGNPGIAAVLAAGGTYQHGLVFTKNNGQTVVGAIYRTVDITAGSTYRVSTTQYYTAPAFVPDFANYAATAGASAKLVGGSLALDATASNAGKTVDIWVEGEASAKHSGVVLNGSGKATLTSDVAADKKLAIVESNAVVAWVTTADVSVPTDATDAATKVIIASPDEGVRTVVIPTGAANANQTFRAYGWSTATDLGLITTDANGDATVDASALSYGDHTIALVDGAGDVVAWGTVTFSTVTETNTDLEVDVTVSGIFSLTGVAASVDLGDVKRGESTTASLGAFKVTDDRALLPGWTLTAATSPFVNAGAGNDQIAASALSIAPAIESGESTGLTIAGSPVAGSGVFAEGAANSSTLEAGTTFNANLTFAAPAAAKAGTYTSVLTLTLVSK